jgi:hypothetical protein
VNIKLVGGAGITIIRGIIVISLIKMVVLIALSASVGVALTAVVVDHFAILTFT